MRRAVVPPGALTADDVSLGAEVHHHLKDVLRLRDGDRVELLDGAGARAVGRLDGGRVRIETRSDPDPLPRPALTLFQGVAKGDKMDRIVRPAAELGVARFAPLRCARAVPRGGGRPDRWRTIADDALRIRGRGYRMAIDSPVDWPAALAAAGLGVLLDGRGERRLADLPDVPPEAARLFVGPEGGFTEDEVEAAAAAGCVVVRLGAATLRTETAGPAAVAALLLGRWGEPG